MTDFGNKKQIRNRNLLNPSFSDLGKIPPQAIEFEEAVIGAMMLERDAIGDIVDILKPEMFYKDEHKEIYTAVISLFEKTKPIDVLTVTNELRKMERLEFVGGAFYISELTNRIGSAANIEHHARIIAEKYMMRKMIQIGYEMTQEAFADLRECFDLMEDSSKKLYQLTEEFMRSTPTSMAGLVDDAIKTIATTKETSDGLSGIPSGFTELDRITSGFQRSDLVIVAARPGMGKTAFVMAIARNAAIDFKKPIAVFSLEMSKQQLVMRMLAAEAEVNGMRLKSGELSESEWHQLYTMSSRIRNAPIYIDDTPALNVFELRAKCRRLKMKHDIQMVIIDYLQLMAGKGDDIKNREQEISYISRSLKGLAKELNIPVIALSQLSRQVEQRGGAKRPILSDLRESGSIEQDADQVMFIYRAEYYGLTEDEDGRPTEGMAEVIIAKNRNGAVGTTELRFHKKYAKFTDLDQIPQTETRHRPTYVRNVQTDRILGEKPDNEDVPY